MRLLLHPSDIQECKLTVGDKVWITPQRKTTLFQTDKIASKNDSDFEQSKVPKSSDSHGSDSAAAAAADPALNAGRESEIFGIVWSSSSVTPSSE
jgi:hypothetical protein